MLYSNACFSCACDYVEDDYTAGQFQCDGGIYHDGGMSKYSTMTYTHAGIYLGDLPATDVGYQFVIEYTSQVNPDVFINYDKYDIDSNGYIQFTNTASIYTSFVDENGNNVMFLLGGTSDGRIKNVGSSYYIGVPNNIDTISKSINNCDKENKILEYKVIVNKDKTLDAENIKYKLTDQLNYPGMKYNNRLCKNRVADGSRSRSRRHLQNIHVDVV